MIQDTVAEIEILLQTNEFLFVNKPSGIPVHRSRECPDIESLVQILKRQTGLSLFPIHRLDRGVSGVIGFGLSSESARELQTRLTHNETSKIYMTLVRGIAPTGSFTVEKSLTNDNDVVQNAKTDFETLASCQYCSVVKARLHTGRRHQIRRHLSSLAHQIIGDRHYGKGRLNNFYQEKYGLNRIFLHALELNLYNPIDKTHLQIHSPLPIDLRSVLEKMVDEGLFKTPITHN